MEPNHDSNAPIDPFFAESEDVLSAIERSHAISAVDTFEAPSLG